jgi:glyoxylase-like metal-dependent hydrolase (beta-lactamase superfamily II)
MPFLTEPEPPRGVALDVLPGIRRIVARNPSIMTYRGTNTYLIEAKDGLTILDPGPDNAEHVGDILRAAGAAPIRRLVLTHAHSDHWGAMKELQEATGAATYGYHTSCSRKFSADHKLSDGDVVAGLKAVFTPGHAPDHLSFAYEEAGTGKVLFSGDHVMSWSSSIVDPPSGDMVAYYYSLERLLRRDDEVFLAGHGPLLRDPRRLTAELLLHRQNREKSILEELREGPSTVLEIADTLYAKTNFFLKMAAQRNVLAHLLKLEHEGRVIQQTTESGDYDIWLERNLPDDVNMGDLKSMSKEETEIVKRDGMRQFRLVPA